MVALFTGMILALQIGLELRRYGQESNIGTLVSISMLREMGPFMTGLIIAASVGSAIAAQMGTMTVSEEIAALEVMSITSAALPDDAAAGGAGGDDAAADGLHEPARACWAARSSA